MPDEYFTAALVNALPTVTFPARPFHRTITSIVLGNPSVSGSVACYRGLLNSVPVAQNSIGQNNTLNGAIDLPAGQAFYVQWSVVGSPVNSAFARISQQRVENVDPLGGEWGGNSYSSWSTGTVTELLVVGPNNGYLKIYSNNVTGPIIEWRPPDVVGHTISPTEITVGSSAQPYWLVHSPTKDGGNAAQLFLYAQDGATVAKANLVATGGLVQLSGAQIDLVANPINAGGVLNLQNGVTLGSPNSNTVSAAATGFVSTISGTYTNLANDPGVAFVAPPSGKVLIHFACACGSDTAAIGSFASVDVKTGSTIGAGVSVYAANDNERISDNSNVGTAYGRTIIVTGLVAGNNHNARMMYKRNGAAGNAGFAARQIIVQPLEV
jgi:hypothetical protein